MFKIKPILIASVVVAAGFFAVLNTAKAESPTSTEAFVMAAATSTATSTSATTSAGIVATSTATTSPEAGVLATSTAAIATLTAPTLIAPNEKTVTAKVKPFITGLVKNGATVHFYIDGVYNGKIVPANHPSGTANFAYKPFLNLAVGHHQVWVYAEDALGNKTGMSNVLKFKIEQPFPAPTMMKPVVNSMSTSSQPFIVGLAKNDSEIKVYIDKKLAGRFKVRNHESGTANFAFKPASQLSRGTHLIYTTATDSRGKESSWSNLTWYKVSQPQIVKGEEEKKDDDKQATSTDEEKNGKAGTSSASEGKFNISGNLIVFILFLLAVIAWIYWVNRELAKERRDNDKF